MYVRLIQCVRHATSSEYLVSSSHMLMIMHGTLLGLMPSVAPLNNTQETIDWAVQHAPMLHTDAQQGVQIIAKLK
jgi:hypothetical protein